MLKIINIKIILYLILIMGSINNYEMTKSLNGINYINADEIQTDILDVTTLTTQNIDTNDLVVTGSITLPNGSIIDTDLTSNVALLNRNPQTFTGDNLFNGGLLTSSNFKVTGTLNLPNNSIIDANLSTNVPLKNTDNTFTYGNKFQNIQPLWDVNGTDYLNSYRIGNHIGIYQNILSNNNLSWGNYCLNGAYNSNPLLSRTNNNITIGHYTGYKFADIAGDDSTSCNRNVILGNNALKNAFINTSDNVVIGNNCAQSVQVMDRCVVIGSNALGNNGNGQSQSTVIGYNNFINSGYGGSNTIIGCNNINNPFTGNGITCIGTGNLNQATDNNRGLCIGTESATSHYNGYSCFYIGSQTGNHNYDGYSNIYIGNYIGGNSASYYNNIYIGHHDSNIGENALQNSNEFVIGGCFSNTGYSRLTLPQKNYLYCCQFPSTSTFNLSFRTEDTVILSTTTTVINLPSSSIYNYNQGARFTFIKNYSTAQTITINAPSGQFILDAKSVPQTSIILSSVIYRFKLYVINSSTISVNTWAIENDSVPSNVALKDAINEFATGIAGDKIIKVMLFASSTEYVYINNNGLIGFYNGGSDNWVIDSYGNATFTNMNLSSTTKINSSSNTIQFWSNGINSVSIKDNELSVLNRIKLTNTSNSVIIGDNISANTPTYSILIGDGAGKNLASGATKITAIGKDALYSLGLDGNLGFEDFAIGPSSLYNLRYGNYNTAFGFGVGQILKNACFENTFCGHNIASFCYSKPINSSLYSNGTVTFTTTFTLPSMPTSPAIYAGCRIMTFYNGQANYATSYLINPTTRLLTLTSQVNISNNTYVYFFENGEMKATYTPPTTVTSSGAQMTIGTGLSIQAGYQISYQENATFMAVISVVAYNSSTGLLNLSSNITVLGGSVMYFTDTTVDVTLGYGINNNTIIGSQTGSRLCSGASGNTLIGQNTMSANEGTTPKNYLGGSNNTAIGLNAGANAIFMSNNCTFIGANAGTTMADPSKLTHSMAIGADAKVNGNYTIVIGSGADDVIISKQLAIRSIFYPYAVRTILTANIVSGVYSFPTNVIFGTNIINAQVASILITMPATISTAMVGSIITFRNINQGTPATTTVNINYASGTNKIYYQTNGVLSTTGTAQAPLLTASKSIATMRCISTTEWTIDQ